MENICIVNELRKKLLAMLKVEDFKTDINLTQIGLNSIMIMKISAFLKRRGIDISFGDLIEQPTFDNWVNIIKNLNNLEKESAIPRNVIKNRFDKEEFELTDVQYAYWAGRQDDQELGGVGCHAYFEFEGEIADAERLKAAWRTLQKAQPMLRAKFTEEGTQLILGEDHLQEVVIHDLRNMDRNRYENVLQDLRNRLSHEKMDIQNGVNIHLECALLPFGKSKLFLDADLMVADVASIHILIKELTRAYNGEKIQKYDRDIFKKYLLEKSEKSEIFDRDKKYWNEVIEQYPYEAPAIPLKKKPHEIKNVRFNRKSKKIKAEIWNKLQKKAMTYGMTPAMFLLTVYSSVISRWTNQKKFIINIPLFARDEENQNVGGLIADFTNLLLLDVSNSETKTFLDYYREINKTFISRVSHSNYSGVRVQRDINRINESSELIAPVVFACNIDFPFETKETRETLGKLTYMISQTPQVWLDFQSFSDMGDLILCWDYVEELFDPFVIEDMYSSMIEMIEELATLDNWDKIIDVLPSSQKRVRKSERSKILPLQFPESHLYTEFLKNVEKNPESVAIIDSDSGKRTSYKELKDIGLKIAAYLKNKGIKQGDYIAITLPRGYRQIYAIIGILFLGGTYVPIASNQPKERRKKIYSQIGIRNVVTDKKTIEVCEMFDEQINLIDLEDAIESGILLSRPEQISYDSSAYVIMTSGSTGMPKGVEISHQSAMNTILDLNEKYNVGRKDSLLMVSSIDFDLSVYDIFGILSAGGAIISLNEENYKNPDVWLQMLDKYNISMWNSVPILFDMLVTMAEGRRRKLEIKLVFLSGDWIPIELPTRFYNISNLKALIVAMGGATEASIWSNFLEVPREVPDSWSSIPYGKALRNQVYQVVDDYGRICPNYVTGELWIGGAGLAKGYRGDKQLTEKKFILDCNGMRWYKTGDNGTTWNDGTIEFLGRKDSQVKIKGHRIELGEIENAIKKYHGVRNTIVSVVERNRNDKKVVAFIQIDKNASKFFEYENSKNIDYFKILNTLDANASIEIDLLNSLTLDFLKAVFENLGIMFENPVGFDEIVKIGKVTYDMENVLFRWIELLVKNKDLQVIGNVYIKTEQYDMGQYKIEDEDCFYSQMFHELLPYMTEILQGKKNPIEIFYDENLNVRPDILLKHLEDYSENVNRILRLVQTIIDKKERKNLRILEIGGRDVRLTEDILKQNQGKIIGYTYLENTIFFQKDYHDIEKEFSEFEYKVGKAEYIKTMFKEKFDIVILPNSLHRFNDIEVLLQEVSTILKTDGYLFACEPNRNLLIVDVIPSIIEKGFAHIDISKRGGGIIPDAGKMSDLLEKSGYKVEYINEMKQEISNGSLFWVGTLYDKKRVTFNNLESYLEKELPSYMMPFAFYLVDEFPVNKNGKVDRKKLNDRVKVYSEEKESKLFKNNKNLQMNKTQSIVKDIFEQVFKGKKLDIDDNYFSLGGDSLTATQIIGSLRNQYNINVSIRNIFENPSILELARFIDQNTSELPEENKAQLFVDKEEEYKPFPLTNVQFAYWIGRKGAFNMGRVSTHCYFEFECEDLDIPKFQKVWNDMIIHHGMLRDVVCESGEQKILKEVPMYLIQTASLVGFEEKVQEEYLIQVRKEMSRQVLNAEKWPLFDLKITIMDKKKSRLHINFDNLILDGWSMFALLDEMAKRYRANEYREKELEISFRDYVISLNEMRKTEKYERDKAYWLERLNNFSYAPKLPLVKKESELVDNIFSRRTVHLEENEWEKIKNLSKDNGITPTVFFLTVFSDCLRRWSYNKNFALNLTQFERTFQHPEINELVGDFTNLTLLEIRYISGTSFIERAKMIQKQLTNDLEHSLYTAVEFERELRQRDGNWKNSIMPIVFTSGLGISQWEDNKWIGKLIYNISQTPQVWLDHQIVEQNNGLTLNWDSVDELLSAELLDEMFENYRKQIYFYIANPEKTTFISDERWENLQPVSYIENNLEVKSKLNKGDYQKNELSDEYQRRLILIWEKILRISIEDSNKTFFELGGDSLGMVRMVNEINENFQISITIVDIVEHSSIQELVEFLVNNIEEGMI